MSRLIANMAAAALSSSNEHPDESAKKVEVHYMDHFIQETTLDLNLALQDLSKPNDDNRLFRFYSQLRDYAGTLCMALKEHDNKQTSSILSQSWTLIVKANDEFEQ